MIKLFSRFLDAFSVLRSLFFTQEINFENIDIKGSKQFREKVLSALVLLKERDVQAFQVTQNNLNWIIEGRKTLLSLTRWGGTLSLSEEDLSGSQIWLASLLAGESFRAQLYKDHSVKGSPVPKEVYSWERVLELQYESLKNLGANFEELKHLADFIEIQGV